MPRRWLQTLEFWAGRPRFPLWIGLAAAALAAPALSLGPVADDHTHHAALARVPGLPELHREPGQLFAFFGSRPDGSRWEMPRGVRPWWAHPELRLAFWRPLTGLTHALDYALWPESPAAMHAQSIVWFGFLVGAAAALYRSIGGGAVPATAGLAAILFALDDAHAMPAMWVANRNALVAAGLGAVALTAHHRWRALGWVPGALLAPTALGLALLSKESAIAIAGYLAAYALCLDRGSVRGRVASLLPAGAVVLAWRGVYQAGGYGAEHSLVYLDPGRDPWRFAGALVERAPVLAWGQLSFPPADVYNLISARLQPLAWVVCCAWAVAVVWLALPLLRTDPRLRFWALGCGLALVPASTTLPSDRLLAFAGIGGAAAVAHFLTAVADRRGGWSGARWWGARALAIQLVLVHLLLAPLSFQAGRLSLAVFEDLLQACADSLPGATAENERVLIVSSPAAVMAGYSVVIRELETGTAPRRVTSFGTSLYPMRVTREDRRTLALRPEGGFFLPVGHAPAGAPAPALSPRYVLQFFDLLFSDRRDWVAGQRIPIDGGEAQIREVTGDGRPAEVAFRLDRPLDDPSHHWVAWRNGVYVPFALPAPGEAVTLRALGPP